MYRRAFGNSETEDEWGICGGHVGGGVYIKMLKIQTRFDDNFLATGQIDLCIQDERERMYMSMGAWVKINLWQPPTFSHVSFDIYIFMVTAV